MFVQVCEIAIAFEVFRAILALPLWEVSMTKSELIDAVARRTKLTKSRAEHGVNCIFDSMTASLERGEGIEIRGFGSFKVKDYKGYNGRNPKTGQTVWVPPKRLPFFKVGKELQKMVNDGFVTKAPEGAGPTPS